MNKLVIIGRTGHYRCYLNISKEEALKRYSLSEDMTLEKIKKYENIEVIEFEDEFEAYEVWEIDKI